MSKDEPLPSGDDGADSEQPEPEPERIEPECPPNQHWDATLGRCVPDTEPPPPEPPQFEAQPCPFEGLAFPFSIATSAFCAMYNAIFEVNKDLADFFAITLNNALDPITNLLENLGDQITKQIAKKFTETLSEQLSQIDLSDQLGDVIDEKLSKQLDALNPDNPEGLFSAISGIDDSLAEKLESSTSSIAEAIESLSTKMFDELKHNLDDAQIEMLKQKVVETIDQLDNVPEPAKPHIQELRQSFANSPQNIIEALQDFFNKMWGMFLTPFVGPYQEGDYLTEDEAQLATFGMVYTSASILTLAQVFDAIVEIASLGQVEAVGRAIISMVWATGIRSYLGKMMFVDFDQSVIPKIQQMIRYKRRPHRLRIDEATQAYAMGFITKEQCLEHLGYAGLPDHVGEQIIEISMKYPSFTDLNKLYWRGIITQDEYEELVQRTRVPRDLAAKLVEAQKNIPSYSDMIRIAVQLDLGEDWMRENLAKLGYDPEWANLLWGAHWQLPSVQQGYEMRARGELTDEELKDLMIKLDIREEYRDKLFNIRYKLIPRVDLRRAFAAGILDFDELVQRYTALGYRPDDAELEAQLQMRETLNAEISALRSAAESDYKEGYITEDQLRADLNELGFSNEEIELSIENAKRLRSNDLSDDLIKILKELFRKGKIDSDTLRTELQKVLVDSARIEQIIAYEEARRSYVPSTPVDDVSVTKIKTDLVNDYVDGYIDLQTLQDQLSQLAISDAEIQVEIANAELRFNNKLKDQLVKNAIQAYRKELISVDVLRDILSQNIVRPDKVDSLVKYEVLRKGLIPE